MLGSGLQARIQLTTAAAVRKITIARIYSRDETRRSLFAREMQAELGIEIRSADGVREAVSDADIVICATSGNHPVVNASDLKRSVHVNTVGPRTLDGYELGLRYCGYGKHYSDRFLRTDASVRFPFFLNGSGNEDRMVELSDIIAGRELGRTSADQTTLFCSVGLARH